MFVELSLRFHHLQPMSLHDKETTAQIVQTVGKINVLRTSSFSK